MNENTNKLETLKDERLSINNKIRDEINRINKERLKNKNFSIISSNCNGAMILKDLGLQFKSPFVNLYIRPKDFVKYLRNMTYYNSCELRFLENNDKKYPIGYLDDIEIVFLHFKSKQEAKEKWENRLSRINLDNFFVIMSERDGCTYQDLKDFDALEITNKIVFTHKPYPEIASSIYIPGFENDGQVGVLLEFCGNLGLRYFDQFDFISWFNGASVSELKQLNKSTVMKQVIGIRTHKWEYAEEKLYRKLLGYFKSEQIFIIADETKKFVNLPTYLNKVSLNKELLQSFGILNTHPHPNGLGWLCGDYFYYAFANAIQADYYWLIEQDVDFTFHNIATFFQRFENIREDGLLHNFAEANENWAWTTRGKLIDEKVYQAFFPLSRLSRKAIEVCQIERKHLTTHFLEYKLDLNQYPNDEVLVATTLMKNHLKIVKLNDLWKSSFDYFSYKNSIVSPSAHLLLPENQVLHPSRTVEQFSSLITKEIDKAVQNSTTWLDLVDRSTLSVNDVEAIFDQIQENSLQEVKARLERHAKMLFWLDFTKKVVNKELENVSNDLHPRFWIYQGKTVVLDLAFNNATISIEYQINNKMITCNILNRHNAINYMESLKTKMKDYQEMNGKLCLFNLDILSEDISIRIEQSVSNFINLIKDFSEQTNETSSN